MNKKDVDILIIGGGLIGSVLAYALVQKGFHVLAIEQYPPIQQSHHFDARTLALSKTSIELFNALGLSTPLQHHSTPIHQIHISEKGVFGSTKLENQRIPLGLVVEMHYLQALFAKLLPKDSMLTPAKLIELDPAGLARIETPKQTLEIKAKLIVAADGTDSKARQLCGLTFLEKAYHQTALVANIRLARNHQNRAFERFTPQGPLALLPMSEQRMSLIWALSNSDSQEYANVEKKVFLQSIQRLFGYRLGRFVDIGTRDLFPLKQVVTSDPLYRGNTLFIGNAAQTLHPIAGQGFNLGLRDVSALIECILNVSSLEDFRCEDFVKYRKKDRKTIIQATHGLLKLFSINAPAFNWMRGSSLFAFDQIPLVKKTIRRYASGLGEPIPYWVTQQSLEEQI